MTLAMDIKMFNELSAMEELRLWREGKEIVDGEEVDVHTPWAMGAEVKE